MLFLFNNRIFEIGLPLDTITGEGFPMSPAAFDALSHADILHLVREEVFADPNIAHNTPAITSHLAILIAAKTHANAILAGPAASGAQTPADIAVKLAEVSLLTMVQLHDQQTAGGLTSAAVEKAVWSSLR